MKKKICPRCHKNKSVEAYGHRSAPKAYLYNAYCKACVVKRTAEWVMLNKKRHNAYQHWYQTKGKYEYKKKKKLTYINK